MAAVTENRVEFVARLLAAGTCIMVSVNHFEDRTVTPTSTSGAQLATSGAQLATSGAPNREASHIWLVRIWLGCIWLVHSRPAYSRTAVCEILASVTIYLSLGVSRAYRDTERAPLPGSN